jgi:hypothetical protein
MEIERVDCSKCRQQIVVASAAAPDVCWRCEIFGPPSEGAKPPAGVMTVETPVPEDLKREFILALRRAGLL